MKLTPIRKQPLRACTHSFPLVILITLLLRASTAVADGPGRPINHFEPVATYQVSGAVAEIVTATPDGHWLFYTDSESQEVGIVDIRNPSQPGEAGILPVSGEPTSVAMTPNGRWVLVVVHGEPDHLAIYDTRRLSAPPVIKVLGGQPDSIAISPDGRYAVIAIENERDEDVNEGIMPQEPPGFLTIIDLGGSPQHWRLRNVSMSGLAGRFPDDPEPEFVDINEHNLAAVTLQENNHIAIVHLPSGRVVRHFTAGSVTHPADLEDDGMIVFDDLLVNSRREPDAIHWAPGGLLVTANEGDYDLDADFVGGRSFTIFAPWGQVLFDSGAEMEIELATAGLYDDTRSPGKGSEPEGIEIAEYGHRTFLFVGMERAAPGAVAVYRLDGHWGRPQFVQILETGNRPEGLLAISRRNLFVTANEGDGTISIFAGR
jgi:hypothetical protein